jgi:hypothetical protein
MGSRRAALLGGGHRGAGGRHCSMEAGEDGRGGSAAWAEEDRWGTARVGGAIRRRAPVGGAQGVGGSLGAWQSRTGGALHGRAGSELRMMVREEQEGVRNKSIP